MFVNLFHTIIRLKSYVCNLKSYVNLLVKLEIESQDLFVFYFSCCIRLTASFSFGGGILVVFSFFGYLFSPVSYYYYLIYFTYFSSLLLLLYLLL
jgi:hypothetical protein